MRTSSIGYLPCGAAERRRTAKSVFDLPEDRHQHHGNRREHHTDHRSLGMVNSKQVTHGFGSKVGARQPKQQFRTAASQLALSTLGGPLDDGADWLRTFVR